MSAYVPTQMTAQTLNALKGWPQMSAVDFAAPLDPTVEVALPPGSVVHVGPSLTFLAGVGTSPVMPMFTFQGSDDSDVQNFGGDPATVAGVWVSINPAATGGSINAFVAVGAYELVSTNYFTGDDYAPNDHLTSPLTASGGVLAGQLTKGTLWTDTIVGVVSRGVTDNGYGTDALAFWPVYLPPT